MKTFEFYFVIYNVIRMCMIFYDFERTIYFFLFTMSLLHVPFLPTHLLIHFNVQNRCLISLYA